MNRDIKFRQAVYSKDKFHHWHEWGFLSDLTFTGPDSVNGLAHALANSQQYTDKKDKNEVEIYDRDIVALESHHPAYQHTQTYAVIEWVECFLAYMAREFIVPAHPNGKILTRLAHYNSNEIEIIGNATDNPELLEGKT